MPRSFTSKECAFGEEITVGGGGTGTTPGKFVVKDNKGTFTTEQVTHVIEEVKALTKIFTNGNGVSTASIDGSAEILLEGATHKGMIWAGNSA